MHKAAQPAPTTTNSSASAASHLPLRSPLPLATCCGKSEPAYAPLYIVAVRRSPAHCCSDLQGLSRRQQAGRVAALHVPAAHIVLSASAAGRRLQQFGRAHAAAAGPTCAEADTLFAAHRTWHPACAALARPSDNSSCGLTVVSWRQTKIHTCWAC